VETLIIGAVLVGAGIIVLTLHVASLATPAHGVDRSLQLITGAASAGAHRADGDAASTRGAVQRLALRLLPASRFSHLPRHWNMAGGPVRWPVERIIAAKGLAAVGGLLFVLMLRPGALLWALVVAAATFFVPDLLLYNAAQKRQEQIRRKLADSLDILAVIVEAGLPLDSAVEQIAAETAGPVADEFHRVIQERNFGVPVSEALTNAARRNDVQELNAFVSAITQAERLGIPVAAVIREQTVNLRIARRQRAQEKAQKVPVKIIFPLLLFIFPVVFIVVIGPAVVSFVSGS
jgi:tight adherence protein C